MSQNGFEKKRVKIFHTNSGILKFARLYNLPSFWLKLIISIILGVISSIAMAIFVEPTGLYVGGFNAFFQGFARFINVLMTHTLKIDPILTNVVYGMLFWGLYIILNVGLFCLAWKKISKTFAILTLVYIVVAQSLAFVWTIIGCFKNIYIFGETSTVNEELKNAKVLCLQFYNYWYPKIDDSVVEKLKDLVDEKDFVNLLKQLLQYSYNWNNLVEKGQQIASQQRFDIDTISMIRIFSLLLYAIIYGIINGVISALLFITNSSTAGSDIIAVYWSQVKNKPVNSLLLLINTLGLTMGIFLGNFVSGWLVEIKYCRIEYFLTGNLFCSIIWAVVCTSVLKLLFPWRKLIRIEVYSNKIQEINKELFKNNYINPTTILDSLGGFSNVKSKILITIGQVIVLPNLISIIRKVDKNCLISAQYINDIDGRISIQNQG